MNIQLIIEDVVENSILKGTPEQTAHLAVDMLHREALAQQVSLKEQSPAFGLKPHAIGSRYRAKNMKLTEYCRLAALLGKNPVDVLANAMDEARQKEKSPQVSAVGNETRKE